MLIIEGRRRQRSCPKGFQSAVWNQEAMVWIQWGEILSQARIRNKGRRGIILSVTLEMADSEWERADILGGVDTEAGKPRERPRETQGEKGSPRWRNWKYRGLLFAVFNKAWHGAERKTLSPVVCVSNSWWSHAWKIPWETEQNKTVVSAWIGKVREEGFMSPSCLQHLLMALGCRTSYLTTRHDALPTL